MSFSQRSGVPPARHTIYAPLDVAVARMPAVVRAATSAVVLERHARTSSWRWSSGSQSGTVTLTPVGATRTQLEITAGGTSAVAADALAVALYAALEQQWVPPAAAAPPSGLNSRMKLVVVTAAILIPLLAITGMRAVAPPAPMDVASAVTQFRQQSQQAPTTAGGGVPARSPEPRRKAADDGSATRSRQRRAASAGAAAAPPSQKTDGPRAQPVDQQRAPAPRDVATASDDRDAAERHPRRRQAAREDEPVAKSPDEGVYRYATQGYESIDRPSSRHDYPSETAMSIRATDCGFTARWQPLENRWDEMSVCREGGEAFLPRVSTHREFYGQQNDSDYQCDRNNYAYRRQPGATWIGECSDGDATMEVRGRTVGFETIRVGNESIETVHYTLQARISGGDAEGTWSAQRWVDPDTGLLVRVEARTNATSQSSVGTVHYQEELSLRLLSTTPER